MLEMFTDENPMRSDEYKLPADQQRCPGEGRCKDQGCPAHYATKPTHPPKETPK